MKSVAGMSIMLFFVNFDKQMSVTSIDLLMMGEIP
jgi:hypothetical protein